MRARGSCSVGGRLPVLLLQPPTRYTKARRDSGCGGGHAPQPPRPNKERATRALSRRPVVVACSPHSPTHAQLWWKSRAKQSVEQLTAGTRSCGRS